MEFVQTTAKLNMNIAIDIRPLLTEPRTGVGEYVFELVDNLIKKDNQNNYLLFYNSCKKKLNFPNWQKPNIFFIHTQIPNKILNLSIFLFKRPLLDKLIEKKTGIKIDAFYSPHINFTSVRDNTKFILTVHDLTFELYPYFFSLKQKIWHKATKPKKQIKQATVIITPSHNTARDIKQIFKIEEKKIKYVYPGVGQVFYKDIDKKEEFKNLNLPKNYFLFLGTLEPRKNLISVIRAFEKIKNNDPYLVIAGKPGYQYQKIKKSIENSPKKDFIKTIGYIKEDLKPSLYRNSLAFIFPSFYEGFGFPILEALLSNTPVITSARGSLPEIGKDNVTYIDPYHPETILKAMEEAIENKKTVDSTALKEKFDWKKTVSEILNIISN